MSNFSACTVPRFPVDGVCVYGCLFFHGEFDPGSGRTLAACLTHASRARKFLREFPSGGRVSNTWATCLIEGDSLPKGRLIPHKVK